MFTGLIQDIGRVVRIAPKGSMVLLTIGTTINKHHWIIGESIAVNGACLTLVRAVGAEFDVEVSPETLQRTTLGKLSTGEAVNLERAMRMDDRLGGHFVTGHVDAVGTITSQKNMGGVLEMEISVPQTLMPLLVEKGSIAVDGVSLTINAVKKSDFAVAIIPHTLARTTLGMANPGRQVNIESDLLGKYVYRYLANRGTGSTRIDMEFLARHGFV